MLEHVLFAIDVLIAVAGLAMLCHGVRWAHGRDPLRGSPLRPNRLSLSWLWVVLLGYAMANYAALSTAAALYPDSPEAGRTTPSPAALSSSILAMNAMLVLTIVVCLGVAAATFRSGLRGLGLGRRSLWRDLGPAIRWTIIGLAVTSTIAWVSEWVAGLFTEGKLPINSVFEALHHPQVGVGIKLLALFGALVLAPLGEEAMFRGLLQTGIRKMIVGFDRLLESPRPHSRSFRQRWIAVAVTAAVFGLLHIQTPQHIPALIAFGLILGGLYERTGSLSLTVLVHALFNAKSLLWDAIGNN